MSQEHTNSVISIITDKNGNIINTIDTMPFFQLALKKINIENDRKVLLANIFDKNYTVYKTLLNSFGNIMNNWIFEEWRLNSNILIQSNKKFIINNLLKNIKIFSLFEQEVIYSILSGYYSNKEIEAFIINNTITKELNGNVRYTISSLYDKFNCNNKHDLRILFQLHDLDKFLPITIFPAGLYML